MGRGPKPAKGKAKPTVVRKPPKNDGARIRDREKQLAEALRDKAEALEQQTATADILRVIKRSPTDVQPVFDAIIGSAVRLCGALYGIVWRYDGEMVHLGAGHNLSATELRELQDRHPRPIAIRDDIHRMMLMGRMIEVPDVEQASDVPAFLLASWRRRGVRSAVLVPMQGDRGVIGAIGVSHREIGAFSPSRVELLKTFADQAVIAIENVRLFNELHEKNRALSESLEQQTATSEILQVISSSPTDVQPVFETILSRAVELCGARHGSLFRFDGELLHASAHHDVPTPTLEVLKRDYPMPPSGGYMSGRAILARRIVTIEDVLADELYESIAPQASGLRSMVGVPLLRDSTPVGVIVIVRSDPGPFTDRQIALLKTFADQAVIAIENVRLFTETKEALERQTATSEILRVISSSPTDLQPVLDAVAERAARLCSADDVKIHLVDGNTLRLAAQLGPIPALEVRPITPTRPIGRAVLERRTIHVHDMQAALEEYPDAASVRAFGTRTSLAMPLLREGVAIGVIQIRRLEVEPFSQKQLALLETFADQAVIAIENVRLFTELQEKNQALTEALEQQTATSEILRVISSSPTDLQPIFDTIARSAARLCDATVSGLSRFDGKVLTIAATYGYESIALEYLRRNHPRPAGRDSGWGRAVLERRVVHVHDVAADEEYQHSAIGYRTLLAVPLLREETALGAIAIWRSDVRPFSDQQVALVETFADQAVIAIENVRLFTELQEKNRALTEAHAQVTESLEQQTSTAEILRVISRSHVAVQPVFDTIVASAVRLCRAHLGVVYQFDGAMLHLVAHHNLTPEMLDAVRSLYPKPPQRDTVSGRAILSRAVVQIEDVLADREFHRGLALATSWRSMVAVPMLREGEPIGAIVINRIEPGAFADNHLDLLKTFADQAVIAIENVRLFNELEARTQDLTRSVGELRALGEVGQAISSTLDLRTVLSTIVARATELSGTDAGVVYEYDEQREVFLPRATERLETEIVETMLATPVRKGEGATGRLAEVPEPIQVPDILAAPTESRVRGALVRSGYRALLAVPLVREGHLLGGLTVIRKATGAFAPDTIELLQTFATQSSLAIQNARLFRELADKSRQLELASQHKSEFLANMSHELRTPLNAIIGFSEVLSDRMFGELNEKQEEYLKDIYASGTHLLSLINDILDLSKIEAGRMDLELTDFDLPTALDNALMLVRERAQRRSLTLHKDVDAGVGLIQADERKIRQVVLNLLSNAIKFTPEGGRIDVAAVAKDGLVEVSVSDTGIGIAPEDREKVFEEFRQVGTADKKAEGTGLGLTLCRKFIELHGGKIWVKSAVGQGSTFTFTIPVGRGSGS
jgi:GAF domain-containing protein/anti-sigma regulatory factor (Ser/Thr protein kinase)